MSTSGASTHVAADRKRLFIVLVVIALYCGIEIAVGWYANSLALLSDAVHMLTDIAALAVALLTLWISTRPASQAKTYGYLRAEILGALLNGIFLWVLVIFIWIEAARRVHSPENVAGLPMMFVAVAGLVVNSFAAWMTGGGHTHGMAVRAIFVHVLSDLIGSLGVLAAGAAIYFTGWRQADPAVSILIGALVLYSSWGLVRDGVDILMESVPGEMDLDELRHGLLAIKGTQEIHDLHVWCLTSRQFALSAHAVVAPDADHDRVLSDISVMLEQKFKIRHMTVQLECDSRRPQEPQHF